MMEKFQPWTGLEPGNDLHTLVRTILGIQGCQFWIVIIGTVSEFPSDLNSITSCTHITVILQSVDA